MAKMVHPGKKAPGDSPSVERRTGPDRYSEPYSLAEPTREWKLGDRGPSAWAQRDAYWNGRAWAGVKKHA